MFLFRKIDDFELGAASHFLELFVPVMIEGAWFVDNNLYELALLNSQHLLFIAPPYLGLHDVIHPSLVFELSGVLPAELGLADRLGQLEEYEFLFGKPRLNLPFYLFFG